MLVLGFRRATRLAQGPCRTLSGMKLPALLLTGALAFCQDQPETSTEVRAATRLFEAWIEGHDQKLVWSRSFGFADTGSREPVTPQTKFRMASHTKLFTAVAIMQLRDAGKLRLDDPVSKHLRWFRIKPANGDDPPITVEHLLTHSSGLPREAASEHWTTFAFPTIEEVRGLAF